MSEAAAIVACIHSARVDRDGQWKMTLEVNMSDGPKVAALALQSEQLFKVSFAPVK